jgi:hypothetical protein
LNSKIQKGPEPVMPPDHSPLGRVIDAASRRVDHEASLTEPKQA